jgi:hypothetical protein
VSCSAVAPALVHDERVVDLEPSDAEHTRLVAAKAFQREDE